jgi:hypothetical protein
MNAKLKAEMKRRGTKGEVCAPYADETKGDTPAEVLEGAAGEHHQRVQS